MLVEEVVAAVSYAEGTLQFFLKFYVIRFEFTSSALF